MPATQPIKLKPMKIHEKWYDMSGFAHPGGPVMLKCGESRDATALFESHHPFTNRKYLEDLLSKYEVDPAKVECTLLDEKDKDAVFEWPEFESKSKTDVQPPVSDFAHELRTKVQGYLKQEATRRGVPLLEASKCTPYRKFELTFLACLFLSTLPAFVRGEWWTLLATPLTYWVLGVNTFHDGSHFGLCRDWRLNHLATYIGWWFSSPLVWYHQHVIGHHAYPNMPHRDPDLYHNGTFERHTKTLRHRSLHKHQHKTWFPIWCIGTFAMNFLKPIQLMATGQYNRAVALTQYSKGRIYQHYAGRVLVFCLCHVWQFFLFDAMKAFAFSAIPVMLVSLCFMVSSQMNHLTHDCIDQSDTDFYKHQVMTSHSFMDDGIGGYLTFLFTGGLNLQIEHHLFPCINHCHLPNIRKIVKQTCKKHDVKYPESSGLVEAFGKYIDHMRELSVE